VNERTIARRYVRALLELALEEKAADSVLEDLGRINEKLASDLALAATLLAPGADAEKKRKAATSIAAGAKNQLTKDFAGFLVDHGRAETLPLAAAEFGEMLREERGEAVAEVVSSAPLDAAATKALVARLEELTKKKVTLETSVDPGLLGGIRVRVGSMLLDGSGRRRLAGMRDDLLRVSLH
jgi:F-type H+-transporting ATPase subunit delta